MVLEEETRGKGLAGAGAGALQNLNDFENPECQTC